MAASRAARGRRDRGVLGRMRSPIATPPRGGSPWEGAAGGGTGGGSPAPGSGRAPDARTESQRDGEDDAIARPIRVRVPGPYGGRGGAGGRTRNARSIAVPFLEMPCRLLVDARWPGRRVACPYRPGDHLRTRGVIIAGGGRPDVRRKEQHPPRHKHRPASSAVSGMATDHPPGWPSASTLVALITNARGPPAAKQVEGSHQGPSSNRSSHRPPRFGHCHCRLIPLMPRLSVQYRAG